MGIPIARAEVLALFLESLVYGIFFSLYWVVVLVIRLDTTNRWPRRVSTVVLTIATAMLLLASTHILIDLVRAFQGFNGTTDVESFFHSVTSGTFFAKTAVWMLQTLLGDGVLIWRCYVVYGRRIKFVIPMLLGTVIYVCAASGIMYNFSHSVPGETVFAYHKWIVLYFCATMYINILCTGAMTWRIVSTTRPLKRTGSIAPLLIAIVDTAALYTAAYTGLLISFLVGSDGQFAAVDLLIPLIGVTYTLIILQIRFHDILSVPNWSTNPATSAERRPRYGVTPQAHAMQPISVEIVRETEVELDEASFGSKTHGMSARGHLDVEPK